LRTSAIVGVAAQKSASVLARAFIVRTSEPEPHQINELRFCKPLADVRFAPKATKLLRRREMSRRATNWHRRGSGV